MRKAMKEYSLKIAQDGIAAGKAFCLEDRVQRTVGPNGTDWPCSTSEPGILTAADRNAEISRFDAALEKLNQELAAAAAKAGEDNAAIFEAERMILNDEKFAGAARAIVVNEGIDATTVIENIGTQLADEMSRSDNAYISQRSDDVRGMTERFLHLLRGDAADTINEASILVADELSPVQLSTVDPAMLLGIITAKGAPTSHVSILAGNMDIPYYYGSDEAVAEIKERVRRASQSSPDPESGVRLILNDGKLTIDPDDAAYVMAETAMAEAKATEQRLEQEANSNKRRTRIYANITSAKDIDALLESGAEGVGLFRTEFLFLGEEGAPTEEVQFQEYKSVAEAMTGKETIIRTMDLGSDKKAGWLKMPEEKNPALGCRGLRLAFLEEALFRTQLRALLRASAYGNVKVMIPMIASVWEVDAVRAEMHTCAEELSAEGVEYKIPPLGIMVETPAAAMIADKLAEVVDFFSIGTNDLTQYTLALDREAEGLDDFYDPCHEAVLRMIERTVEAGHEHHIPTAICGELGSNPKAIKLLIERGVDELSVSIGKVEATKAKAAEAEEALAASSPKALAAPADGTLIPMDKIPDEAFASGTLGECVGIIPENGNIYAPCDGIVTGVAETGHAITFETADGRNILVHAGLDTVTLGGRGFTIIAKAGDAVKQGDLVLQMDLDIIQDAGLSPMIIIAQSE